MNLIAQLAKKMDLLFHRNRFHSELDEEMVFHREQAEEDLRASGMSPQTAHVAAARQFGNATHLREQSHSVVAFRWESVAQDLRGRCDDHLPRLQALLWPSQISSSERHHNAAHRAHESEFAQLSDRRVHLYGADEFSD